MCSFIVFCLFIRPGQKVLKWNYFSPIAPKENEASSWPTLIQWGPAHGASHLVLGLLTISPVFNCSVWPLPPSTHHLLCGHLHIMLCCCPHKGFSCTMTLEVELCSNLQQAHKKVFFFFTDVLWHCSQNWGCQGQRQWGKKSKWWFHITKTKRYTINRSPVKYSLSVWEKHFILETLYKSDICWQFSCQFGISIIHKGKLYFYSNFTGFGFCCRNPLPASIG